MTEAMCVDAAEEAAADRRLEGTLLPATALAAVANAVFVTDAAGAILWANGAFTAMSGYPLAEALGSTPRLLKSGEQDSAHYATLWATITAGRVWRGEIVNRHRDGHHYRVRQTITPVVQQGRVTNFVAVHEDVTEQRRAERQERFQAQLLEAVGDAVVATDLTGAITYANPAAERLYGWPGSQLLAMRGQALVASSVVEPSVDEMIRRVAGGRTWSGRVELRRADGSTFPALASAGPYRDDGGRIVGVIAVAVDVTDLVRTDRELRRRVDQQQVISELGQWALQRDDPATVATEAAHRAQQLLGVTVEVTGRRPAGAAGEVIGPLRLTGAGVARLDAQDRAFVRSLAHVVEVAGQRAAAVARLEHLATHDPVTGLPNRTLLLDRLEQVRSTSQRSASRFAVLLLDLDDFKVVNDSLGHHVGDEVLQAVAGRLIEVVRPGDTVARIGGDEFVVLCPEIADQGTAEAVAERIRASLAAGFTTRDGPVSVTASVGIVFGDRGTDTAGVLRDADTAMYWAKDGGRNRSQLFDGRMQDRAVARFSVNSLLHSSLGNGGVVVHYQPVLDLATGRITGAEALARLRGDDGQLVGPDQFIGLAEDNGLIVELGGRVLEIACADASRWRAQDPGFTLSVNLSPRQLTHPDTAAMVAGVLAEHGLPAAALCLEITESALVAGPSVAAVIERLRATGVRFAIDDFGTGYSSLAHLRHMPVDMLKIDRSFVDGMHRHEQDRVLVIAVTDLARAFGLEITAEGVETPEQAQELAALGCHFAQGYLWSRPVDAVAFAALLAEGASRPRHDLDVS